ncbi:hypothetical protein RTM1035_11495 [Roseovarius sp. TM1035]|nr:hypothetical protein RTM1035_11495 [Roseovarius sp. TM1035]
MISFQFIIVAAEVSFLGQEARALV